MWRLLKVEMLSYITQFQPSAIIKITTVFMPRKTLSKLSRTGISISVENLSIISLCRTYLSFKSLYAFFAKSYMPRSEKMYMKRNKSAEKFIIPSTLNKVFLIISCMAFQRRRTLIILSNLRERRANKTPEAAVFPSPKT